MPGIGLVIDGAMQHAPQPGRHEVAWDSVDAEEGGADISGLSSPLAVHRAAA